MSKADIKDASEYTTDTRGIFTGMPMQDYQLIAALSASGCTTLRRSPLDFLRQRTGEVKREASDAMELGTVYHSGLWEDVVDYHVRPDTYPAPESTKKDAPIIDKPWSGNATWCKGWLLEHSDKPVYSAERAAEIERNVAYIRAHPLAAQLLDKDGHCEVSIFARAEKHGHMLKGRPDKIWFDDEGRVHVADLKTTNDATTRAISRTVHARRYHVQAAMYRYILERLGYVHGGHTLIFFEEGAAPKCNVRQLAKQAIDKGEAQLMADLDLYYHCRLSNVWPEWSDAEDGIGYIDLPDYVYGEETLDMNS